MDAQSEVVFRKVEQLLGIDTRSLAIFRILIGCIVLYDLWNRAGSIVAHYTDAGIVSRQVLRGISENSLLLSLNMLSGGVMWQVIIWMACGVVSIALIMGYRSQFSSLLCWVFMLSIHIRNPFVNNLGDWLLLNLLLWGALLPLGASYSIDRLQNRKVQNRGNVLSVATMGVILQVLSIYFFSVFYKTSPIWHTEGTAIYYALSLDRIATPLGTSLLNFSDPWLMWLTSYVLHLERWAWVVLLFPFFVVPIRTTVAFLFICFHLGLALCFNLGVFPYVCIVAWILFIPGPVWDMYSNFCHIISGRIKAVQASIRLEEANNKAAYPSQSLLLFESLIGIFLVWVVFSSNLYHAGLMGVGYYDHGYRYVEPLVNSLNLKQRWNMFSPHPSKRDGWFLVVGEKKDGTLINVLEEGERIDWKRPENIAASYTNQRWRKNLEWAMDKWDPHAHLLASYLLRDWNSRNESSQIERLSVYFMEEYTQAERTSTPINRVLLASVSRFEIDNQEILVSEGGYLYEKNTAL